MTQNVEKDRMISGVKFAALLLTLMIGCTSVGIVASYNLHAGSLAQNRLSIPAHTQETQAYVAWT